MNIGIIVHSHTGHTLKVAKELEETLSADGHAVTLEQVEPAGEVGLSDQRAELKSMPAVEPYDALVLGSPVWGGRPSAPMTTVLEELPPLEGERVACLVTHFFPAGWGASQTLDAMKKACESKGANTLGSGNVRWLNLRRGRDIAKTVERLSELF